MQKEVCGIKILSIDFDYFQKVSKETLEIYPVGIDRSTEISEIIWNSLYHDYADILQKVTVMHDELDKLKKILLYQRTDIPVMAANSHRHIYDFIHDYVSADKELCVVNADMHHDMFNDNDTVDCGNWLKFIYQEYRTKLLWICNPVSKEMYGIAEQDCTAKKSLYKLLPESLDIISGKQFDMIFLCRSDIWTPPHLDCYFSELCEIMQRHFDEVCIHDCITQERKYLL